MSSFGRRDYVCLTILAVACVLVRAPSLDRVSLNPDESQFEAIASYLVADGVSPLTTTFGEPGTFALFAALTRLAGPYPIFEIRLLVLLVCLGMSWIVFWIVRREADRVCALAAAGTFLFYNQRFEGFTVNREWFAMLMTAVGVCLWLRVAERPGRGRDVQVFLSGLACGFAVWFKLQAAFTLFVVPLAIGLLAAGRRAPREGARGIVAYGAGLSVCGAAHLIPFWAAGSLQAYLGDVFRDWRMFVLGNETAVESSASGTLGVYLHRFLLELPHKPLLLAAYLATVVVAVSTAAWIRRPAEPRPFGARPSTIASALWLVLALACVKLGFRFFAHYYLLMLPATAILVGFALHWLRHEASRRLVGRVAAFSFLLAVAAEAAVFARQIERFDLPSMLVASYVLGVASAIVFLAPRPLARAPAAAAVCLGLQILWLAAAQSTAPTPRSMSHNPYSFDRLAAFLRAESRPGDRLFVWGWAPEIYPLSGLVAASYVATTEYVVQDFLAAPPRPSLDRAWVDRMMRDLERNRPRFIVDASDRSWTSTDKRFYRLDLYPRFALVDLLARSYTRVADVDGCAVYERRP